MKNKTTQSRFQQATKPLDSQWRKVTRPGTDTIVIGNCPSTPDSPQSRRRRAWIIKRAMTGQNVNGDLNRLEPKDRPLVRRLLKAGEDKKENILARYLERFSEEEKKLFAAAISAADLSAPDPDQCATGEDLLKQTGNVTWLWDGWLPYGMLSMLAGSPGAGKSALALFGLALPVMTGCRWPDGQPGPKLDNGRVMWVDTESSQIILATRIRLWNIPPKQLISPYGDFNRTIDLESQEDLDVLRESVRIQKPRLVVIDSLRSAHKSDENSSRVGGVLEPLTSLARDTGAAFLVIHHLRKIFPGMEVDMESIRGSNSQTALCRSIPTVSTPDPNSRWQKLVIVKSNVGLIPPAIGFRVANKGLEFGAAPERPKKKTVRGNAEDFLRGILSRGKCSTKEVSDAATKQGINAEAIKRARKSMGVIANKEGKAWVLSLPENPEKKEVKRGHPKT